MLQNYVHICKIGFKVFRVLANSSVKVVYFIIKIIVILEGSPMQYAMKHKLGLLFKNCW